MRSRFLILPLILAAVSAVLVRPSVGADYDFAKLVNYEFATTSDVRRVEAKVDAIGSKVDALASEVGSLKSRITKSVIADIGEPLCRPISQADEDEPSPLAIAISSPKPSRPLTHRVSRAVVVTCKEVESCAALDPQRQAAFDALRAQGWSIGKEPFNRIQVFDADEDPAALTSLAKEIGVPEGRISFPFVSQIENRKIVRRWTPGCTTPMDAWLFEWLATGEERQGVSEPEKATVARSGRYPVTGHWWSVEGKWSPSKEFIVNHLLSGSQHRGRFTRDWLESLSYAELQSVHTDDHTGRLQTQYVGKPLSERLTANLSPPKPIVQKPSATVSWVTFPQTARSSCPGGVCPLVSGVRYRKR